MSSMSSEHVTLADIVMAYAEREKADDALRIAAHAEDRSDIVGEEAARRARAELSQASARARDAEVALSALLSRAYREALAADWTARVDDI